MPSPPLRDYMESLLAQVREAGNQKDLQLEEAYQQAISKLEQLAGSPELSKGPQLAEVLIELGDWHSAQQSQRDWANAVLLYQQALDTIEQPTHPEVVAAICTRLSTAYSALGSLEESCKALERVYELLQTDFGPDYEEVWWVLSELASLLYQLGELSKAEPVARQALSILKNRKAEQPKLAVCYQNLALIYRAYGQLQQAIVFNRRALRCFRSPEATLEQQISARCNLGTALVEQGSLAAGQRYLVEAHRLAARQLRTARRRRMPAESESLVLAQVLLLEASLAIQQRHPRTSLRLSEQAYALISSFLGPLHPDSVRALILAGNSLIVAGTFAGASSVQRRLARALQAESGLDRNELAALQMTRALLLLHTGRARAALHLMQDSFRMNEAELQVQSGLVTEDRLRQRLAELELEEARLYSLAQHRADAPSAQRVALEVALLRKGRAIEELRALTQATRRGKSGVLQRSRAALVEATLRGQKEEASPRYEKRLRQLEADIDAQEEERALSERPAPDRIPLAGEVVDRVAAALPGDAALIEFVRFVPVELFDRQHLLERQPAQYMALVLTANGKVRAVDLGEAHRIEQVVSELLPAVSEQGTRYREAARSAYAHLLERVLPLTGRRRRLFISPAGALGAVPFAALDDGQGLLIDRFDISYLSSGRDLLAAQRYTSGGDVVMVADPAVKSVRFGPLPGARAEARAIARLFPSRQVRLFEGSRATKEQLLEIRGAAVLHVAAHGWVASTLHPEDGSTAGERGNVEIGDPAPEPVSQNPMLQSGLLLGTDQTGREFWHGLLTPLDLLNLDLSETQLVVLSACSSGYATDAPSSGAYGLVRSVLTAGAGAVVASLWDVHDDSTRLLMTTYYRLLRRGLGCASALTAAMRLIRRRRPHPYHWAPFVAMGADHPLRL
jgi:CHAT domain-containing protein